MAIVTAPTNIERLYLAGEWVETGESFEVRSPHSGEVVATIARAGADEARRAIDAAERAMREAAPAVAAGGDPRAHLVSSFASDADELARTICAEAGKPLKARACRGVACRQHATRSPRARRVVSRASRCPFAARSPATAMWPGRCASPSASSARSRRSTSRSTSSRTSSRPRSPLDAPSSTSPRARRRSPRCASRRSPPRRVCPPGG